MSSSEYRERAAEALRKARAGGAGFARACCPFCDERVGQADRNRSLALNTASGWWSCWRCQAKGKLNEEDFVRAAPRVEGAATNEYAASLPEGWRPLWTPEGQSAVTLERPRQYLKGRGIGLDLQEQAEAGACYSGYAARRIVVPFRAPDGRLLGWIGRTWLKYERMRYLYPSGMPRGEHLYHEAAIFDECERPVYLVEGMFDCWALWPDACAFLGKPGGSHLSNLRRSVRPLVALLDGDAWRESEALMLQLRILGKRVTWVKLPSGKDPATVDRQWVEVEAARGLA